MLREFPILARRRAPGKAMARPLNRKTRLFRAAGVAALGWMALPGAAQTQTPPTPTPPQGVVPVPQTPPPTGPQAPLPPPAASIPKPDRPSLESPTLAQLGLQARPLTLNDAVAIALATNKSLALAEEALLRAQGRTSETRAAFNPTVSSTYTFTHLNQGQTVTFNGQSFPLVKQNQSQIGVQATLPIDITCLLRAATQQAQFQEIAARLDVNRARNQIVLDVKTAFYDVLRAQALVRVANEALQNALDRLSDAEKKFRAGTVARFDVIRAQTDVANAQQQLITARSNVSLAIANLNNTIGIDVNTPLQVADTGAVETPPDVAPPPALAPAPATGATPPGQTPVETPVAPPVQNPAPGAPLTAPGGQGAAPAPGATQEPLILGTAYDAVLREALQTRPEILQADTTIAAARKGILLARRSQLPTLGLAFNFQYTPDAAGFSPMTTSWQAVAQVNLPLYEGGLARARVTQARADVATAETNRRQTVDLVTLDVRQAYLNLLEARNRVAVANQALGEAQESYRLARVRYNAGVSALVEVSDAQAALTQAESNQVSALYDYNNARARLDKAAGRYSYVSNGPGYATPPPPQVTGAPGRGERR